MSTWPPETPGPTEPAPRPGMSTGAKVLLILGIVFGGLVLLCCGGVMISGVLMQRYFARSLSEDPQTVRATTAELAQLEIPDALAPQAAMDLKVPFSGRQMMTMAIWSHQESNSVLMLMGMGKIFGPDAERQMKNSMRQSLREQGFQEPGQWQVETTRDHEVEIRGETVQFTIGRGRNPETGAPRVQVSGVFQGESGPVMLMADVDARVVSEDELIEMLESIE